MNEHAKQLHFEIVAGLENSPLVRVDVNEFASSLGVSLRSGQRYLKELQKRKEYECFRRSDARYFKRPGTGALSTILESATWSRNSGSVVSVANDSLSISNIDIEKKDILSRGVPDLNTLSPATNETTATTNGAASVAIWYESTDGDFQELTNAVCEVCKMNPLLLLDEDEKKLAKLFKANVNPGTLRDRYSWYLRPNYWNNMHWKGRKGARPTIADIMQTWEQSDGYVYQFHHDWPPVNEIQETIKSIMDSCGRRKAKLAMEQFRKYGYDKIIDRIPGGYYQLTMMKTVVLDIKIATAVRDIITEANKERELIKE